MAQQADHTHRVPHTSLSHSNLQSQSAHLNKGSGPIEPDSSTVEDGNLRRANSTMSQSHTLTPSRGGTLKKKQSLNRKTSLKRSGSGKGSRPGSVKGLTFSDDVVGHGSEMNSAFFSPVPTTGSPTDILANRFQGMSLSHFAMCYSFYEG